MKDHPRLTRVDARVIGTTPIALGPSGPGTWARSSVRAERRLCKADVGGSNPLGSTLGIWRSGSATRSQRVGREFESPYLHPATLGRMPSYPAPSPNPAASWSSIAQMLRAGVSPTFPIVPDLNVDPDTVAAFVEVPATTHVVTAQGHKVK